jgi:hypothetical protein
MAFPARTAPTSLAPAAPSVPPAPQALRRGQLEALLRERKLDRTLTTAIPETGGHDAAGFGVTTLTRHSAGDCHEGRCQSSPARSHPAGPR